MPAIQAPPTGGLLLGTDGVKSNMSDFLRPNTVLRTGNNLNMVKRGIITNRYSGWLRQRPAAFNAGAAFLDFSAFVAQDGTRTLLFQCGATLYSYDGATETAMQAGLDVTRPPCMRMFAPYSSGAPTLIYCNGVDQPKKFLSVAAASGAPLQLNGGNYPQTLAAPLPVRSYSKPQFCEPFLDRMIYAGFTGVCSFDVLITNSGTAETCTTATPNLLTTDGGVFTVNPALGAITGIKAFKLSNTTNEQVVLIAQLGGVSLITGTNALEFQCYTLTAEYGIPSNRTWVQVMNDMWFLATDGVRRFATLVENGNLMNAALTLPIQDVVNLVEPSLAQWAHMTHHRIYQEVTLWFTPTGGTQNSQGVILNYNNDQSTTPGQLSPTFFTKDGTTVGCSAVFKNAFYGGGYSGLLQTHYTGNLYDTVPVKWEIVTALIKPRNYENNLKVDKFTILTEGTDQKFLCNAFLYQQVGNSLQRQQVQPLNYPVNAPVSPAVLTILGSWLLGLGGFVQSGPKRHFFNTGGYGAFWELQIRGDQADHTIDWLGAEYRSTEGGPNA